MTESYFAKVANDVLEATEQIATRMEEGLTAIMKGETPKQEDHYDQPILDGMDGEDGEDWLTIEEELRRSSPLEGIAESVMGNIMAGQVRMRYLQFCSLGCHHSRFSRLGEATNRRRSH
jgi:hypothetical protein